MLLAAVICVKAALQGALPRSEAGLNLLCACIQLCFGIVQLLFRVGKLRFAGGDGLFCIVKLCLGVGKLRFGFGFFVVQFVLGV